MQNSVKENNYTCSVFPNLSQVVTNMFTKLVNYSIIILITLTLISEISNQ